MPVPPSPPGPQPDKRQRPPIRTISGLAMCGAVSMISRGTLPPSASVLSQIRDVDVEVLIRHVGRLHDEDHLSIERHLIRTIEGNGVEASVRRATGFRLLVGR